MFLWQFTKPFNMKKEKDTIYFVPRMGNKAPYIEVEITTSVPVHLPLEMAGKNISETELLKRLKGIPTNAKIRVRAAAMK